MEEAMASRIRRIAVLTSGGDGPGFNPCIRAVVRTAINLDWDVIGIKWGYVGLINGEMVHLTRRSVGGIIGKGGTFLGTARSPEFRTKKGQVEALRNLNEWDVNALVVIGGDGSMRGAMALVEMGLPVIGLPGSIDNDLYGTDMCIGVDTALNTALEAMDRIKDTASSHQRAFLVEVMGRNCGYLALMSGVAGGAEMSCIPEVEFELEDVAREVSDAYVRGKTHCIISVAEGARYNANAIAAYLIENKAKTGFSVRVTILGHVQRGGSPTAFDRVLATRLGAAAVEALNRGESGVMMGLVGNVVKPIPMEDVANRVKELDSYMFELAQILAK